MSLMKLFRDEVEKSIEKSPLLLKAATVIVDLAREVNNLGMAVIGLSQLVQEHHTALQELYARHGMMMKAIKSNSIDMQMPDVKSKEPAKPN